MAQNNRYATPTKTSKTATPMTTTMARTSTDIGRTLFVSVLDVSDVGDAAPTFEFNAGLSTDDVIDDDVGAAMTGCSTTGGGGGGALL